ncbi:unnamed protein product [Ectocarpus sp. 6 AP-2014]
MHAAIVSALYLFISNLFLRVQGYPLDDAEVSRFRFSRGSLLNRSLRSSSVSWGSRRNRFSACVGPRQLRQLWSSSLNNGFSLNLFLFPSESKISVTHNTYIGPDPPASPTYS